MPGMIPGNTLPSFRREGETLLNLLDFPFARSGSGGLSGYISESEMMMVQTCRPTRHVWKDSAGKIIKNQENVTWSFLGRFPGEIERPGMYQTEIWEGGKLHGILIYEVI